MKFINLFLLSALLICDAFSMDSGNSDDDDMVPYTLGTSVSQKGLLDSQNFAEANHTINNTGEEKVQNWVKAALGKGSTPDERTMAYANLVHINNSILTYNQKGDPKKVTQGKQTRIDRIKKAFGNFDFNKVDNKFLKKSYDILTSESILLSKLSINDDEISPASSNKKSLLDFQSFEEANRTINNTGEADIQKWVKIATAKGSNPDERTMAYANLVHVNNSIITYNEKGDPARVSQGKQTRIDRITKAFGNFNFKTVKHNLLKKSYSALMGEDLPQKGSPQKISQQNSFKHATPADRKAIFDCNSIIAGSHYSLNGANINISKFTKLSQSGSKFFTDTSKLSQKPIAYRKTDFDVVNKDCIDHALALKGQGYNPLVLDMANASTPGGGAYSGHGNVQEEQIVYRSNLYTLLNAQKPNKNYKEYFIPHKGSLLIPDVAIFRKGPNQNYAFTNLETLDIIAAAAYKHENRKNQGQDADSDTFKELKDPNVYWGNMQAKIESVMIAGIENGNDTLVLGAFGTGAFKNPVPEVIQVFKNAIEKYGRFYKRIDFAVLDGKKGGKVNAFSKAFK